MLREDFMPPYGLTVASLAEAVGVSRQSINELLLGRRVLSTEMALRFARLFGTALNSGSMPGERSIFGMQARQSKRRWKASNRCSWPERNLHGFVQSAAPDASFSRTLIHLAHVARDLGDRSVDVEHCERQDGRSD